MRKDDYVRFQHMLEAAKEAVAFAKDRQRADLEQDRMLTLAIIKDVEIIGEAASKMSGSARESFDEIPWDAMVGMRNRLVHVYFNIDYDRVWDTITDDLPPLIERLEQIVSDYWQFGL